MIGTLRVRNQANQKKIVKLLTKASQNAKQQFTDYNNNASEITDIFYIKPVYFTFTSFLLVTEALQKTLLKLMRNRMQYCFLVDADFKN